MRKFFVLSHDFFVLLNQSDFEEKSPSGVFCMIRSDHAYFKKNFTTKQSENCTRVRNRVLRNIGSSSDLYRRLGRSCFDLRRRALYSQFSLECFFFVQSEKWWCA